MSVQPLTDVCRESAAALRERRTRRRLATAVLLCVAAAALAIYATTYSRPLPPEGKNALVIRGRQQDVYFYPAQGGAKDAPKVLFLCGNGGWLKSAPEVAAAMARMGYDVYGFDTKRYLESFTTDAGALKEADVQRDMAEVARWMRTRWGERVTLAGQSTGAGLAALAAVPPENKGLFKGVVVFGLSDKNELGWRARDDITYITGGDPDEPMFRASDYMGGVAPLPVCMIQSSGDQFIAREEAEGLFAAAHEPKLFKEVRADNHVFDGNTDGFYGALREGLGWVEQAAP
jgi:dienelactone hydrolase